MKPTQQFWVTFRYEVLDLVYASIIVNLVHVNCKYCLLLTCVNLSISCFIFNGFGSFQMF
jgi:hypothetical protein